MIRKAFTLVELLVVITIIGILAMMLTPAVIGALEEANKANCANNLKNFGTASHVWASSHRQEWPDGFPSNQESTQWDKIGGTREDEDSFFSPGTGDAEVGNRGGDVESNTASMWKMVVNSGLTPRMFRCPSTDHGVDQNVVDYATVRDFRGHRYISYSYQNVAGGYRLKETAPNASEMAVMADANPQREDFTSAEEGREGATTRKLNESIIVFPDTVETEPWNDQLAGTGITDEWELNSPNHNFKGQNVLYLDGHVEWQDHPYCGPRWDNIWLRRQIQNTELRPDDIESLRAFNDEQSYEGGNEVLAPGATNDSFLVP